MITSKRVKIYNWLDFSVLFSGLYMSAVVLTSGFFDPNMPVIDVYYHVYNRFGFEFLNLFIILVVVKSL